MAAGDETKRASGADPVPSEEAAAGAVPSQRRRRLLKGALSAPMILTPYNAAALARTSNVATIATTAEQAIIGLSDDPLHYTAPTMMCVQGGGCDYGTNPQDGRCDAGLSPSVQSVDIVDWFTVNFKVSKLIGQGATPDQITAFLITNGTAGVNKEDVNNNTYVYDIVAPQPNGTYSYFDLLEARCSSLYGGNGGIAVAASSAMSLF